MDVFQPFKVAKSKLLIIIIKKVTKNKRTLIRRLNKLKLSLIGIKSLKVLRVVAVSTSKHFLQEIK